MKENNLSELISYTFTKKEKQPTFAIHINCGVLNESACNLTGLKEFDCIEIQHDKEEKNIYIKKVELSDRKLRKNNTGLQISNTNMFTYLCKKFGKGKYVVKITDNESIFKLEKI